MATDLDTMSTKELAVELGFPEGSERYQKAKAELNYRQLKGLEQQQIAMLVGIHCVNIGYRIGSLGILFVLECSASEVSGRGDTLGDRDDHTKGTSNAHSP